MSALLQPSTDELLDLLNQEERLYAELVAIGQQEQGAILGNDPAWLHALVAQKERVIEQVARVETERQSWIAAWAAAAGATSAPTLAELARQLPPHEAGRISVVRDALLRRIRDVAEMNHRNGQLVNGALRIVNRSIDVYSRVGGDGGYAPSGEPARGTRTVVLDRKV
jgi:flagellar biosynthesis/type III secretory pathway chaperone